MSRGTIFKPDNFDPSQFTFTTAKANNYGGKAAYVNFDKHRIRIESPKMYVPWGLSTYPKDDPNPQSYSINMSFPKEMDPTSQKFHDLLEQYDDMVVKASVENSQDWLGRKTMKEDMARGFYSSLLYKHKDPEGNITGKYPDSLSLKIRKNNDGEFSVKCFGPDKQRADVKDVVVKGCYIKAIFELNGVYLKKNAVSASATALQIRVYPPSKLTGYAFLPDEDDDEVIVLDDLNTPYQSSKQVKSSEAENEPENEAEVEPEAEAEDKPEAEAEVVDEVEDEVEDEPEAEVEADPQDNSDEASAESPPPTKKPKFSKKKK